MDFVQAATNAIALLPPLLPAILDGGAKEIGKTAAATALDRGKKVWALLSGAADSGPLIAAGKAVADQPDDKLLQKALEGHIMVLLKDNEALLQQVVDALADERSSQTRRVKIKQGKKSIANTGEIRAKYVNSGKIVKKKES